VVIGGAQPRPASFMRYQPLAFRCVDCHADAHRGQFGKKEQARCEKCHQATQWRELLFVHNRDSAFKLEGAHAKAECEKCHVPMELKDRSVVIVYKPMKKDCAACHR
jgi:Zn finger protein HypA/HybF involved in hydrogenase expression